MASWMRSLLFWGVLAAVGAGVWAGINYSGTEAAPWIKGGLGGLLIFAGVFILLARDMVDQRISRLHGGGLAIFGAAQFTLSPWSLVASLMGLAFMAAAIVRRRRLRQTARPAA